MFLSSAFFLGGGRFFLLFVPFFPPREVLEMQSGNLGNVVQDLGNHLYSTSSRWSSNSTMDK